MTLIFRYPVKHFVLIKVGWRASRQQTGGPYIKSEACANSVIRGAAYIRDHVSEERVLFIDLHIFNGPTVYVCFTNLHETVLSNLSAPGGRHCSVACSIHVWYICSSRVVVVLTITVELALVPQLGVEVFRNRIYDLVTLSNRTSRRNNIV